MIKGSSASAVIGIWFLLLVIAVVNGALRDVFITPVMGISRAHNLSCIPASIAIFAGALATFKYLRCRDYISAVAIGATWLAMTLTFEFGFGWLRGLPVETMLAEYNILNGRLWPLVLLTTAASPAASLYIWKRAGRA